MLELIKVLICLLIIWRYSVSNVHTKEILKKAYSEGVKNYISYNNDFLILTKTKKTIEYIFNILSNIINSTIDKVISNKEKSKLLYELDSIPRISYNISLPIGNLTSQIFAVYYLNDLDHYLKEKLGCKYYIRYMDDFVILSNSKSYYKN